MEELLLRQLIEKVDALHYEVNNLQKGLLTITENQKVISNDISSRAIFIVETLATEIHKVKR